VKRAESHQRKKRGEEGKANLIVARRTDRKVAKKKCLWAATERGSFWTYTAPVERQGRVTTTNGGEKGGIISEKGGHGCSGNKMDSTRPKQGDATQAVGAKGNRRRWRDWLSSFMDHTVL